MDNPPNAPARRRDLQRWLTENELDSTDTVLVLFVFVFISLSHSPLAVAAISLSYLIGNKQGKKETFYSGKQIGYREGIKEGLKQGSRHAAKTNMQGILTNATVGFFLGLLFGFRVARAIYKA